MTESDAAKSRRPRITPRAGAVVAALLLAGAIPAESAAAGTQPVDTEIPYTCRFPSGAQDVAVRIAAELPDRVDTGEEIQPREVAVGIRLPESALTDISASRPGALSAQVSLDTAVAQGEDTAEAEWTAATEGEVPVPETGDVTLPAPGLAPSMTTQTPGDLTVAAGDLAMDLTASPAAGGGEAAAEPLSVACSPAEGADSLLASIAVTGPDDGESPPPGSTPGEGNPDDGAPDGPRDGGGTVTPGAEADEPVSPEAPADPREDAPPCPSDVTNVQSLSAYITGFSNVEKLKGAARLPLMCGLFLQYEPTIDIQFPWAYIHGTGDGELMYKGRPQSPPVKATFLTFGFMPTTATMVLEQKGPMRVVADSKTHIFDVTQGEATAVIRISLVIRITDVRVNGTPLDVGPDCRTAGPLYSKDPDPAQDTKDHMVLSGFTFRNPDGSFDGYTLGAGGTLPGSVTIPRFEGCGAEEDLDPLFTASVSGPDNLLKQTQGGACSWRTPEANGGCTEEFHPRDVPQAER
ncbi:DUF6801 domain-containing protein [Streptomyces sp. NPDC004134]|uniref:DUF6801 domain-containing protein n=1 Tax=Streptomyces sp. NPDC004134 TaxID=3364691 RepID=UPI0036CA9D1C